MTDSFDQINNWFKAAATRDFVAEGRVCTCGSNQFKCIGRVMLGPNMHESFECTECGEQQHVTREDY